VTETHTGERFLPYRKADLVDICAADERLADADRRHFREFAKILSSVFHFEFHQRLERLKDCYAPFDPDSDTRPVDSPSAEELGAKQRQLVEDLSDVLRAANYAAIERRDLEAAMEAESLFKIRLQVDFEEFEEALFFRRGESRRRETIKFFFGLRRREIEFVNYDRVAIYVKFKPAAWFEGRRQMSSLPFQPGSTVIKLFQNVPKADLEMLFPNTRVRMRLVDKLLIGVPAAVGGAVVVATKLFGVLLLVGSLVAFWLGLRREHVEIDDKSLVALGVGLATLSGFVFRQVNKFKNRKIQFMKTLADNLYFKNLDNNAGVFHRLLDDAEEEECKEAILGYFFLLVRGASTEAELDAAIEAWFRERFQVEVDFEVDDALHKLERLGLVERDGTMLRAPDPARAIARLDALWDGYFHGGGETEV
jgi:hypothetical protein